MLTSFSLPDQLAAKDAAIQLKLLSSKWKKEIAIITLLKFALFLATSTQLIILSHVLEKEVLSRSKDSGVFNGILYLLLLALLRVAFNYFADRSVAVLTGKVITYLRKNMLSVIARDGNLLINRDHSGSIALSLLNKTEIMAPYFSRYIPQMILCTLTPMTVFIYLLTVNWICALMLLFMTPLIPVFMIMIGKGTETKSKEQWQKLSVMGGFFADTLQGMTTLHLFGQAKNQVNKIKQTSRQYADSVLSVLKIAFLSSAVLEFFSAVVIAGAAIYIGLNMMHYVTWGPSSAFSLKNGLIILLLIPEFFMSLKMLGNYYHDRTQALGAVMDLQESGFFQTLTDQVTPSTKQTGVHVSTDNGISDYNGFIAAPPLITFKNVCFSYNSRKTVFHNLDLKIKPYEKIRITGANGSGKSTLISLLLCWQKPDKGTIYLDEDCLDQFGERKILQKIGLVSQGTTIFDGTIRSNILMDRELSDLELRQQVLDPLSLHGFIDKFPSGLDTLIAEDGRSISGGERQKIGLARAMATYSPILLLDEPLIHLDPISTSDFLEVLDRISANKTIILTGHGESYDNLRGYREIKLGEYVEQNT